MILTLHENQNLSALHMLLEIKSIILLAIFVTSVESLSVFVLNRSCVQHLANCLY